MKRYSVYRKGTDLPVVVYGTAQQCARAMGIKINTFYHYVNRIREGKRDLKKFDVYEDNF